MRNVRRQFLASLCEPDGVEVGFDKIAIGKLDRRRADIAVHHPLRPLEVILIVWALGCAIAHNERRLAGASRAPRALRVIGGCWRYISQINRVQRGNIDTKLHGGRAEQDRQKNIRLASLAHDILGFF